MDFFLIGWLVLCTWLGAINGMDHIEGWRGPVAGALSGLFVGFAGVVTLFFSKFLLG